jgi:hypothetical protein
MGNVGLEADEGMRCTASDGGNSERASVASVTPGGGGCVVKYVLMEENGISTNVVGEMEDERSRERYACGDRYVRNDKDGKCT